MPELDWTQIAGMNTVVVAKANEAEKKTAEVPKDPVQEMTEQMSATEMQEQIAEAKKLKFDMFLDNLNTRATESKMKRKEVEKKAKALEEAGGPQTDLETPGLQSPDSAAEEIKAFKELLADVTDPELKAEMIRDWQNQNRLKGLPPEIRGVVAYTQMLRQNAGDETVSTTAVPNGGGKSPALQALSDMVETKKMLIELGVVRDANAVQNTPVHEDDEFTKIAKEHFRGKLKKALEVMDGDAPANKTNSVPPEERISALISDDGKVAVEKGGFAVKLTPDQFIRMQTANGTVAAEMKRAEAEIETAKMWSTSLTGLVGPAGDAFSEFVRGGGGEGSKEQTKEVEVNQVPCPECIKHGQETYLEVKDPKPGDRFKCPKATEFHPDKPVLIWNVPEKIKN